MKTLVEAFSAAADRLKFRGSALDRLAAEMVRGEAPARWHDTAAIERVDHHFQARSRRPNFWAGTVLMQLALGLSLLLVAIGCAWYVGAAATLPWMAAIIGAAYVAIMALHHAMSSPYPTAISPADYVTAGERLEAAGDAGIQAPSVLGTLVLNAVLAVDGILAATALMRMFATMVSPRMQGHLAVALGIAFAAILAKLLDVAARESAAAARVAQQRDLARSTDPAERALAASIKRHCAGKVATNFAAGYPMSARGGLMVLTVLLCLCFFAARDGALLAPAAGGDAGLLAAEASDATVVHTGSQVAGNVALSLFLLMSLFAGYKHLVKQQVLGATSERDRLIIARFASADEVALALVAHADTVKARANHVYAVLGGKVQALLDARPVNAAPWPRWDVTFPARPWSKLVEHPAIDFVASGGQ